MPLQNLHTHSTFCDGKDNLEELIESAIELKMYSLGFSSHSFTEFDQSYCMKDEHGYQTQCRALKEKYRGKIDVFCGLELDYYSQKPDYNYDYMIGSVHYIKVVGEYIPIDESPEILISCAYDHFGGDIIKLCERYFETAADVVKKTECDIIGHFDLINKFCEKDCQLIDTNSHRFKDAMLSSLDLLLKENVIFEVNTGAMARGLRSLPYPSIACLKRIHDKGGRVILTSDCHNKNKLLFGFEETKAMLRSCGFKEQMYFDGGMFLPTSL